MLREEVGGVKEGGKGELGRKGDRERERRDEGLEKKFRDQWGEKE